MSFYETLRRETEQAQRRLFEVPQILDGLAGRISRETYVAYLTEAYHHVRHTVPLMRLARDRLDPAHAVFAQALGDYMAEEAGHEAWILDDIAAAGGDRAAAAASTPRPATATMVGRAYAAVEAQPMALFGMIFVLEGTSVALASQGAAALAQGLGLGPDCFRYLTSHGALDQDHLLFFERLMGQVKDAGDQAAIIGMAEEMFGLFAELFRAIPHDRRPAHAV